MNTLRIALVGCGVIAPSHIESLLTIDGVKIVGLCDIKKEKAEELCKKYSLGASIYTDYETMLDCEKPYAVHITTPHYLHCDMAVKALERDINVFLEKPVCINEEQIEKLIEAEKNSNASCCVCFQNRYNPAVIKLKEMVRADGGALAASGSVFWERNEKYYTESGWRGAYATEGGGVMINQAIHTIDLICHVLGTPTEVCATKANHHLKGVIEVEDTCEGLIRFNNGTQANFYATTSFIKKDLTSATFITKDHLYRIDGQYLFCDNRPIEVEISTKFVSKECYGTGHSFIIPLFYKALSEGTEVPVTVKDASYAVKVLLAAYRSGDNFTNIN